MDGQEYAEYRERDYERETDERRAGEHQHGLGRKGHVFCDGVELLGCGFQCCESEFGCVHCQCAGAHDLLHFVRSLLLTLSLAYTVPVTNNSPYISPKATCIPLVASDQSQPRTCALACAIAREV